MYPQLLYFGNRYRIVWNVSEHGEAGLAGWSPHPKEGGIYFLDDGSGQPTKSVIEFARPKAT